MINYRGFTHWCYNTNLRLNEKVLVIFHNSRGYGIFLIIFLIIREIGKFDVKVNVIPNRLEKYMAFTITQFLLTACNLLTLV